MVEFGGVEIAYDGKQRFELDLAYATTIHSSQGSEYPGVIMPIVGAHSHMLSRNLIYTAVTRAKNRSASLANKPLYKSPRALSKRF